MRSRVSWPSRAGASVSDRAGVPERARGKASGLVAVALVGLGAAVAQSFGRFTYGVLLPAVRDDFGISNTAAGTIGTVNVGAYLAGTIAVAAATSTFRLLVVLRVGFVFSTAGLLLAAVAPGPVTLAIALFLTGFGGALIWIPSPVIAADAMAPERRAFAIGLMGTGIGLGVVFSGQLAGLVRASVGDAGWRTVYLIEGSIAVVVLLATFTFIGHRQGRPSSKAGIGGFSALRRMRGWIPLTAVYTAFGFFYLLVIGFITTKLEDDNGWTESRASLAFTLMGLAMIVGGPTFIFIASRIGPRLSIAMACTVWALLAVVALPGWLAPTLFASVGLGMMFSGLPSMITLYVVENTSVDDFGPSFAAATLAFGLAQMASPQVGGLVADVSGSFSAVFAISAGIALTGAAAALQLPKRRST